MQRNYDTNEEIWMILQNNKKLIHNDWTKTILADRIESEVVYKKNRIKNRVYFDSFCFQELLNNWRYLNDKCSTTCQITVSDLENCQ